MDLLSRLALMCAQLDYFVEQLEPLLPRVGASDLGLAVSVPLPIVTGIFVLLWFQSRLT